MPTFLIEFRSAQAACAHLAAVRLRNAALGKIVLINPAAQEYLQTSQPARDPGFMPAVSAAPVTLPPWKLVLRQSRQSFGAKAQELGPSAQKDLRTALKRFRREVLKRHRNAMIIRFKLPAEQWEQLLPAATRIASDYNFINPAIAEKEHATLAFVPLSVDPPAAMHYAKIIEQLRFEFGHAFKIVACPQEVAPYHAASIRGKISRLVHAMPKILWRRGR